MATKLRFQRLDEVPAAAAPHDVVGGQSRRMRALLDFVSVVAGGASSVLITGETGTGKETIARLIHDRSSRRHKPFVAVSCAILTENLVEAELFGHARGAFTGAVSERPGRFELANGGTLLLDDIDDVPLPVQVKLLRVLQSRTVERVGATRAIPVDVRVIAASKRDLAGMVADGTFRDDLFYRLNVIPLAVPPLRERREDIPVLMDHFLSRFFRRRGEDPPPVSPAVRQAFVRHSWPGNVRELENACERIAQTATCGDVRIGCVPAAVLFSKSAEPIEELPVIEAAAPAARPDLPCVRPVTSATQASAPVALAAGGPTPAPLSLDERLREVERELIVWGLKASDGNRSQAAALLRIKRSTLGDRIRKLGLVVPGEPSETRPHAYMRTGATHRHDQDDIGGSLRPTQVALRPPPRRDAVLSQRAGGGRGGLRGGTCIP